MIEQLTGILLGGKMLSYKGFQTCLKNMGLAYTIPITVLRTLESV